MKKIQIFTNALLFAIAIFCSNLAAQTSVWSQYENNIWTTNLNAHVGIGTSDPNNAKMQFDNTLGNKITLWGGGPYNYGFGVNGANLVAYIPGGGSDRFSVRADSYDGPEQFMVTSDGKVGIGGAYPNQAKMQFDNTLGNKITLWGGGPYNYGFGVNGANLVAYIPGGGSDRFSVRADSYDGPEQFMVTSDGKVGIGGAYPTQAKMQFDNALGNKITLMNDPNSNAGFGLGTSTNNLVAYIPNTPGYRFSIRSNNFEGAEKFIVNYDGKVSAGSRLMLGVTGTESLGYSLLQFKNVTSTKAGIIRASLPNTDIGNAPLISESSTLSLRTNSVDRIFINNTGNVGIGTTNPTFKLAVNGTIRAKEVRVETGWADYVFEPAYKLRPLAEVESYIQQNQHLPDVTSAADIQKDGLQVGEQMTQMMRKIEELTLYVIDLKKENAGLQERLEKLEK